MHHHPKGNLLATSSKFKHDRNLSLFFSSLSRAVRAHSTLTYNKKKDNELLLSSSSSSMLDLTRIEEDVGNHDIDIWEDETFFYDDNNIDYIDFYSKPRRLWKALSFKKKAIILKVLDEQIIDILKQQNIFTQEEKNKLVVFIQRNNNKKVKEHNKFILHHSDDVLSSTQRIHFNWNNLPPALQVVYDIQGHRQEIIDGNTFWRFLTQCSIAQQHDDDDKQHKNIKNKEFIINEKDERNLLLLPIMDDFETYSNAMNKTKNNNIVDDKKRNSISSVRTSSNASILNPDLGNLTEKLIQLLHEASPKAYETFVHMTQLPTDCYGKLLPEAYENLLRFVSEGMQIDIEELDPDDRNMFHKLKMAIVVLMDTIVTERKENQYINENKNLLQLMNIIKERQNDPKKQHLAKLWEELLFPSQKNNNSDTSREDDILNYNKKNRFLR